MLQTKRFEFVSCKSSMNVLFLNRFRLTKGHEAKAFSPRDPHRPNLLEARTLSLQTATQGRSRRQRCDQQHTRSDAFPRARDASDEQHHLEALLRERGGRERETSLWERERRSFGLGDHTGCSSLHYILHNTHYQHTYSLINYHGTHRRERRLAPSGRGRDADSCAATCARPWSLSFGSLGSRSHAVNMIGARGLLPTTTAGSEGSRRVLN